MISILIPTYNRPFYLERCIYSCLRQSLSSFEILIGDDSRDDSAAEVVARISDANPAVVIRLFRNSPPLGQSRNVDRLIRESRGNYISLMHDDDWYVDGALSILLDAFKYNNVVIAYGRQFVADDSGVILHECTAGLNSAFWRDPSYCGFQKDIEEAALSGQFPNNGWLASREAVLRVCYSDTEGIFGTGSDFRFSALFSVVNGTGYAYLVDTETAVYRRSNRSISRGGGSTAAMFSFRYVLTVRRLHGSLRVKKWLRDKSPVAIRQACRSRQYDLAFQWFFSRWHLGKILTPGGIRRGGLLFGGLIRQLFVKLVNG